MFPSRQAHAETLTTTVFAEFALLVSMTEIWLIEIPRLYQFLAITLILSVVTTFEASENRIKMLIRKERLHAWRDILTLQFAADAFLQRRSDERLSSIDWDDAFKRAQADIDLNMRRENDVENPRRASFVLTFILGAIVFCARPVVAYVLALLVPLLQNKIAAAS